MRPCICGKSSKLPLCDGSHDGADWSCAAPAEAATSVFLTSSTLQHLGRRLAVKYGAVAVVAAEHVDEAAAVTALVSPSDLLEVRGAALRSASLTVVGLGLPAAVVADAFPGARALAVEFEHAPGLFREVCRALDGDGGSAATASLRSVFLSHAVKDEPALHGPLEYLREAYGADVFLCADSIPSGAVWFDAIYEALRERELFVQVVSQQVLTSTSCSFEAGAALALGKPVRLVSLDGTPPPPFLQHIQASSVERQRASRPWLTADDALVEILVALLAAE